MSPVSTGRLDPPTRAPEQRLAWRAALGAWISLLVLCLAWELVLAPIRPGGSWLALKAVPLLLPLRGLWRGDPKTFQWALLLVMLYLMEGVVRVFEPPPFNWLAWSELLLVGLFVAAAIAYLRPYRRATRARNATTPP